MDSVGRWRRFMADQSVEITLSSERNPADALLTGWSWARITKTYMTFLADFERWKQQQPITGAKA
jgi:hypothetical protein